MDVMEKLVELLGGCPCESDCDGVVGSCQNRKYGYCNEIFKLSYCAVSKLAQHLIANGVTVQEWVSVKDKLPDKDGQYLIFTTQYFTPDHIDEIDHKDGIEISGYSKRYGFLSKNGLHAKYWCEMPQPPKGE